MATATARAERRLAAILAADVLGYSRLIEQDETATLAALKALRQEVIDPLLAEHRGRIVKLMGDGAIVEFGSVVDAVACAVAIQKGVAAQQADTPAERRIVFRIGINLGDVVVEGDDLLGDGVNVAARLEQICEPGGVLVSGTAYDHLQGKLDLPLDFAGEQHVKNIARPVRSYRVRLDGMPARRWSALPVKRFRLAAAVVLSSIVLAGSAWHFWPGKPASDGKPSLAVLPLENLSADPEQTYLADGIAEDLITELARNPDLIVLARNSSFSLKGQGLQAQEIARKLGVRYVLEGSLRRGGDRLRINAQLIDGRTGSHVWAERFDLGAREVYEVQDRIVDAVAGRLASGIREKEKADVLRRPPDDLTVYELALRGLARKHRFTKEDYLAGRAELERAVALDPDYAPALLNLAFLDTVDIGMQITGERTPAHLDNAIARLRRVTELDPRLPTAYQALSLASTIAGDSEGALVAARRAVELGPGDAENLLFASRAETSLGNFARSLELAEEAVARNPVAPAYYDSFHGRARYGAGNTDAAISSFRSCLAKSPGYHSCRAFLAASLAAAGRLEEAQREITELRRRAPTYDLGVVPVDIGFPGVPELTARLVMQLREAGLPDAGQPARP